MDAAASHAGELACHSCRPHTIFFALACSHFTLAMLVWPAADAGWIAWRTASSFHSQELLWGAVPLMVAGFVLTAVRRWTGGPIRPDPSVPLLLLWAGGVVQRATGFACPGVAGGIFMLLLGGSLARWLLQQGERRNFPIALLICCMGGVALAAGTVLDKAVSLRLTLALLATLLLQLSARIVPALTAHFVQEPRKNFVAEAEWRTVCVTLLPLALWAALPNDFAAIGLALLAVHRLALIFRWEVRGTIKHPRLATMLAGCLAIPLSLAALASSALFGLPGQGAGLHLLAISGVGVLGTAVMASMTQKHRGTSFKVDALEVAAYVLMGVSVLLRVAADGVRWMPTVAGASWSAASLCLFVFFSAGFRQKTGAGRAAVTFKG